MNKLLYFISLSLVAQLAFAKGMELIEDTILWRSSSLPGYNLTVSNCSTCHSAQYAEYQPPNSNPAFWKAQVSRMKKIFNAPIPDEDVPAIVEYLNQTYGDNRK